VSLTAPAANATVSATVSISALASDDVGVAGVQFRLNGVNVGAEDSAAPYSVSYDSRLVANGSYTLTAVARDAAGNLTTSVGRTVTVSNAASSPPPGPDSTKPAISITTPTSQSTYATAGAGMTLGGSASDNVGITQVTWTNSRGGSGSATFNTPSALWSFSNVTLQSGSNVLTVTARDAANNTQTDTLTVTYTPPTSSFTMDVAWAANTDNPDGYNIYVGTSTGNATTLVKTLVKSASGWDPAAPFVSLTSTEVRNAVGASATQACVAIRAFNSAGVSSASPGTCATLP
jgi:hypothetical protein